ncbi:hypothetical protein PHYSODRAFT_306527 [Phytophthora sojae]|uniref:Uncharacterized protein n=1 Tax=Phytophthora sojae (strain P6497) TaxID=1094619 RepID=G5A9N6_PHYSP|nr:hypothetical protein PHYSODRAFT_306527 [Phytophthora sojae]EGZ07316.1 hypothetical protein PHYSODRAFT_306527 [Phytophthora sojae]|eukprot:XP_009536882.1 hypothetical protein PHYSODRAFT_306527 [Phytophthora sojae]
MPLHDQCRQVNSRDVGLTIYGGNDAPLQFRCRQADSWYPCATHSGGAEWPQELSRLSRSGTTETSSTGLRVNRTSPTGSAPMQLHHFIQKQEHRYALSLLARERLLSLDRTKGQTELANALRRFGITPPGPSPAFVLKNGHKCHLIDKTKQYALSELLRRSRQSLPEFIRLVRGESQSDPRPNKALTVPGHLPCWRHYPFKDQWRDIVAHGVRPKWRSAFPNQSKPPPNHGSARRALNVVIKNPGCESLLGFGYRLATNTTRCHM